jgi:uncharacterized SAM-binding protein YcdF (DUF218 family)
LVSFTDAVVSLIKTFLIPGSLSFLLLGLTAGVLLAYGPQRSRRLAVPVLTFLAAGYWLGSLPIVSNALATRFHARSAQPVTAADLEDVQAIVVLGAGADGYVGSERMVTIPAHQTVLNALEGARVFRLLSGRVPVIASGGIVDPDAQQDPESVVLRDLLMRAGVPDDRILLESNSRTTHEQAINVAPMLKVHQWSRVALVTPPVQSVRAVAVFQAAGVHAVPAVAPYRSEDSGKKRPASRWLPDGEALDVSARATYDYLAWVYYWARGWLK